MRASRRIVAGLIVALSMHALVLAIASRVDNAKPTPRTTTARITIEALRPPSTTTSPPIEAHASRPPDVPTRHTPASSSSSTGSSSSTETNPIVAAPAPSSTAPSIDLRRGAEPSLQPTTQSMLDSLNPEPTIIDELRERLSVKSTPPKQAGTPRGLKIVAGDHVTPAGIAEAAGEMLDGRKLAQSSSIPEGPIVLHRQSDGSLEHQAKKFTAIIKQDGVVSFIDHADVSALPGPLSGNGRTFHQNMSHDPTLAEVLPNVAEREAKIDAAFGISTPTYPIASGNFDGNSSLSRLAGSDPLYEEKMCFLEETRTLREEMTKEHRALADARALYALDEQLAAILENRQLDLAAKKREIFELWADCANEGEGTTGTRARNRIEQFVRVRMPIDSPRAFTVDELAAFNATIDAGERFAPYT